MPGNTGWKACPTKNQSRQYQSDREPVVSRVNQTARRQAPPREGGNNETGRESSRPVRVPVASTSRPGARKAHGTAGRAFANMFAELWPVELFQTANMFANARPKAVLEQPSPRRVVRQGLRRRNIVPLQSNELNRPPVTKKHYPTPVAAARR
ncbi:hypothetical protein FTUN_1959 [Frigoriglobus tundricola]|uniref:Uncharacterized protein n=1 Tax=Frigoriglobus tundricola TaxID=2774151 RepID=A0A6M5YK53_9BACT|nr:hypothetical protein FTUN_1959 [Frigoriglobus tundricola]